MWQGLLQDVLLGKVQGDLAEQHERLEGADEQNRD
jgi:hypothetical protein